MVTNSRSDLLIEPKSERGAGPLPQEVDDHNGPRPAPSTFRLKVGSPLGRRTVRLLPAHTALRAGTVRTVDVPERWRAQSTSEEQK